MPCQSSEFDQIIYSDYVLPNLYVTAGVWKSGDGRAASGFWIVKNFCFTSMPHGGKHPSRKLTRKVNSADSSFSSAGSCTGRVLIKYLVQIL